MCKNFIDKYMDIKISPVAAAAGLCLWLLTVNVNVFVYVNIYV